MKSMYYCKGSKKLRLLINSNLNICIGTGCSKILELVEAKSAVGNSWRVERETSKEHMNI